jgi:hypothetical protein
MKIASEGPDGPKTYDLPMITSSLSAPCSRGGPPAISVRLSPSTSKSQGWFARKGCCTLGHTYMSGYRSRAPALPQIFVLQGRAQRATQNQVGISCGYFYLVLLASFESRRGMDWRSLGSPTTGCTMVSWKATHRYNWDFFLFWEHLLILPCQENRRFHRPQYHLLWRECEVHDGA